jgi:hypothetical protein
MTHEATHAKHAHATDAGSATLPAAFSILLTLIWGAYTALVCFEIFSTPLAPH